MRSVQPCPIDRHACVQMLQRRDASSLEISFFIGFHRSRVGCAGAQATSVLRASRATAAPPCRDLPRGRKRARKRHDQDIGIRVGAAASLLGPSMAWAQQTIRVGWTIPAEEAKYWMMRRPEQFPDLGKGYKIEWVQFQGTAPMVQAMAAGALDCSTQGVLSMAQGAIQANLETYIVAQHVGEKPGSFSVYWAVKDDSPIKTIADMKGKSVGINVFGSRHLWPDGAAAQAQRRRRREGHQAGRDRISRLRGRDPLRARRRGRAQPAVRRARGGQGRPAQAVRARGPAAEHRAHHGGVPRRLRRQESRPRSRTTCAISPPA